MWFGKSFVCRGEAGVSGDHEQDENAYANAEDIHPISPASRLPTGAITDPMRNFKQDQERRGGGGANGRDFVSPNKDNWEVSIDFYQSEPTSTRYR